MILGERQELTYLSVDISLREMKLPHAEREVYNLLPLAHVSAPFTAWRRTPP